MAGTVAKVGRGLKSAIRPFMKTKTIDPESIGEEEEYPTFKKRKTTQIANQLARGK